MPSSITESIAIDGPPGSGLTSVAIELASMLGFACISTGLMYRATAHRVGPQQSGTQNDAARKFALNADFEFKILNGTLRLLVDHNDVTDTINDPAILPLTSRIAQDNSLREILHRRQRQLAMRTPSVVEGRDVGTSVLPDARWRFFLDAPREFRYRGLYRIHGQYRNSPSSYLEFARQMFEVEQSDQLMLDSARNAKGVLYHYRRLDMSSHQCATVLYYYISSRDEILTNAVQISKVMNP